MMSAPAPHDTPQPEPGNIDAKHWHWHLTTFWVLLGVFLILMIGTVISCILFAYGPYRYAHYSQPPIDSFPKWDAITME